MLQYYKQEIRDLRNPASGQFREVYKVLLNRSESADQFLAHLERHSHLGPGVMRAALVELVTCLGERLAESGSVTIPELGTISVAIRPKVERDKGLQKRPKEGETKEVTPELNARSIEFHHLNFRPSKELLNDVSLRLNKQGALQLVGGRTGVRLLKPKQERRRERFAVAREYLAEHAIMHVADYANLTGLSRSSAQRELQLAAQLTHSGIIAEGSGSHRYYILAPSPKDPQSTSEQETNPPMPAP